MQKQEDYLKTLKSAVIPADKILQLIKNDTGDAEALEQNYKSLLKVKSPVFGDSLFLDPGTVVEVAVDEQSTSESEKFKIEKLVETINLASFAYNIYMGSEIKTCTNSFFRTVACFSDEFTQMDLSLYFLLKFAILRHRLDVSLDPESEIYKFLEELFPHDISKLYIIPNKPGNDQIEYALGLIHQRFAEQSDAELIEQEYGDPEEIHDKLHEYIMFRYVK
ncbi:uncharacterized protein BX663DRAFT_274298 [Cokeromyces recurvatus]|uniref:uncharacterized protein n=1 Tax=Cokeromyces recurvatus TaxID=90255 RepID=UPI00222004EB|nr:uncharacterized protein BX663DRAFT_274298 [Cokeromyces recurvatus]KAI7898045.1 hypothetical protein BX663DRAFT_274298 [Cokeromyces recurvatus]